MSPRAPGCDHWRITRLNDAPTPPGEAEPGPGPAPWPATPWWNAQDPRQWSHYGRRWRHHRGGPPRRSQDDRLIAGVAGGLSRRLGIDVTVVRIGLVLLALLSGFGAVGYVALWLFVPVEGETETIAGRAAKDRRGLALAVGCVPLLVVIGILDSALGIGFVTSLTWGLVLAAAGLILVYRNEDAAERARLQRGLATLTDIGAAAHRSRRSFLARVLVGLALAAAGLALLAVGHGYRGGLGLAVGAVLVIGAFVVLFGPWWLRLARDLVTERNARIRAEERADMAAQVHDSVLQTLALIQRNAEEPQKVAQLARAQERELRSWLFDGVAPGSLGVEEPGTLAAGVALIERDVEATHGVAVDAVTVGDCALDDDLRALLAATREATVNAAKWSGAATVSLYVEVEPASVSVFVRDRGVGFDPGAVHADRRGIAESICGRMARHGGTAAVHSRPGTGTEVELRVPRHRART